jgi:hypothetical protein
MANPGEPHIYVGRGRVCMLCGLIEENPVHAPESIVLDTDNMVYRATWCDGTVQVIPAPGWEKLLPH